MTTRPHVMQSEIAGCDALLGLNHSRGFGPDMYTTVGSGLAFFVTSVGG